MRARLREERGLTLVELLVVIAILPIVIGAILYPLENGLRTQNRDAEYAFSLQQGRTALDGMLRQVRQAYNVIATTNPNWVVFNVVLNGTDEIVRYECDVPQPSDTHDYHECVRNSAATGSPLPAVSTGTIVASNLVNGTPTNPVFNFSPNMVKPTYITATLWLPASGSLPSRQGLTPHTISLDDGAQLPNNDPAH